MFSLSNINVALHSFPSSFILPFLYSFSLFSTTFFFSIFFLSQKFNHRVTQSFLYPFYLSSVPAAYFLHIFFYFVISNIYPSFHSLFPLSSLPVFYSINHSHLISPSLCFVLIRSLQRLDCYELLKSTNVAAVLYPWTKNIHESLTRSLAHSVTNVNDEVKYYRGNT